MTPIVEEGVQAQSDGVSCLIAMRRQIEHLARERQGGSRKRPAALSRCRNWPGRSTGIP
jgi:hypothetical protein